jgi:transcriptional regulator with XRE-family HTH domain
MIKNKRIEIGMSQVELARKLGFKNAQYVSNIERSKCGLAPKYLLEVSRLLDTPVEELTAAYKEDYSAHIDAIAIKQVRSFVGLE